MSTKDRALGLAEKLRQLSSESRAKAEEERSAEIAAFHADDGTSAAHASAEMVARGKAIAYEDAELMVRLLARWIPEGA